YLERAESQRPLRAPLAARHPGGEHAQQGQSPGGDLHAPGRQGGRGVTKSSGTILDGGSRPEGRGAGMEPRNTLAESATEESLNLGRVRWIGFRTVVLREYQRIIRIWTQTILPSAVSQALYFAIFGSLLGDRIGPMGGFGYMQYMAPGLIMMAVNINSYSNVVSSFYGAKFGKHVEELLVSPLPSWLIVSGYVTGGLVRGVLVGLAVTAVSLLFTHLGVLHPLIIVGAALLASIIFSLGGFLNALFAKNFDQVNII